VYDMVNFKVHEVEAAKQFSIRVRRMPSSGMLRRVALVTTDVSEELITTIIRVTGIGISSQSALVASYS
jgi:CelD/BcsL family acetyltransferase involved in cellulose biosynthesis